VRHLQNLFYGNLAHHLASLSVIYGDHSSLHPVIDPKIQIAAIAAHLFVQAVDRLCEISARLLRIEPEVCGLRRL
jgi:hypothetical protein